MQKGGEYTMVSAFMKNFNLKLKIDLDESLPDKIGAMVGPTMP